jgi:transcriptional regulator with XRE-family HTH domain
MIKLKEQKIRQMIAEAGYSVRSWGDKYGFPQGTLSNWLTGARNIKRSSLEKLSDALGVAVSDIADFVFAGESEEASQLAADKEEICRIFDLISEQQRFALLNTARFMIPQEFNPSSK